jgi:hypothetical protein
VGQAEVFAGKVFLIKPFLLDVIGKISVELVGHDRQNRSKKWTQKCGVQCLVVIYIVTCQVVSMDLYENSVFLVRLDECPILRLFSRRSAFLDNWIGPIFKSQRCPALLSLDRQQVFVIMSLDLLKRVF